MSFTVQTVFRNMDRSEWIELLVSKYAEKLESLCDRILSCKVTIDVPRKHQGKENFQVRVDVCVPGSEIVVNGHDVSIERFEKRSKVQDASCATICISSEVM